LATKARASAAILLRASRSWPHQRERLDLGRIQNNHNTFMLITQRLDFFSQQGKKKALNMIPAACYSLT
jgi:hypothetical protein